MADETGYNGWSNYETWVTALWIDNDEGSYNYARSFRDSALEEHKEDPTYSAEGILASYLENWLDDCVPREVYRSPATLWVDLFQAAWGEINWYEIATNYLSEVTA